MDTITHRRACNLCEAICGLIIETQGNTVVSIRGDKNDPLSKGYLCPKAFALKDIYEDPDRLRTPMKRVGNVWQKISWEQAYSEIGEKFNAIRAEYGNDALGIYHGNPSVHNVGTILNSGTLVRALKTKNSFSATSVDQLPHHFVGWLMLGHPFLLPVPDILRTHYMLILGGNPLASNGSMMTAPNVSEHLDNIKKRGGKVVVVDPRKTETAERASEHIFVKPGTDVFFLLGIVHTLFKENLVRFGKLESFTEGLKTLENAVQTYSPEFVARITGIEAETIMRIAREFANSESAVCYGRMGVSVQKFGGVCQWLVWAINILTGNFDSVGGAMFPTPAFDILANAKPKNIFKRWHSRVRGLPEFMGELPVSVMAEEMLTPGEGKIRAFITNCGNPVLSTPNGTQLEKGLESLDVMVSIDIYLNETSRHAHYILPPVTGLQVSNYDINFNALSVYNTAKYSPVLFEKSDDERYDWEIMQTLAHVISDAGGVKTLHTTSLQKPEITIDYMLQNGPYGVKTLHATSLSLQKLKDSPEGIDLGYLQPQLPQRIIHTDKKIQLAPEILVNDMSRVAREALRLLENAPSSNAFTLIGRRSLRSNNSWMHNSEKLMKGKNRCTALMNETDANALGLQNNEIVRVQSRVGTVEIPVEITNDMLRGVISIPHGFGHTRANTNWKVAQQHAGVSVNDLTDETVIDELTGNAAFSNVLVRVEKVN